MQNTVNRAFIKPTALVHQRPACLTRSGSGRFMVAGMTIPGGKSSPKPEHWNPFFLLSFHPSSAQQANLRSTTVCLVRRRAVWLAACAGL